MRVVIQRVGASGPEVGKLTIEHLRPKHKPSTRHVGDIVYTKKKCRIERLHFFFGTVGNNEV